MGFLLKEVLKTLCGRNQWSYAVFWKIGCNNSKLLIWEECYYEPLTSPFSQLGIQEEDRVCTLINKMAVNNLVIVAGEGIIGRAAFTGSHQWVLLNNFAKDAYPPEVYAEVHHQFLAGMQTVAVIPVLPHGVVQLGSFLPIMENMGFVKDVQSLILQLGCIPGALLSEDYSTKPSNDSLAGPSTAGVPVSIAQTPRPSRGELNNRQVAPQTHNLNRVVEAKVLPSNLNSFQQQYSVPYNARSEFDNLPGCRPFGQSGLSDRNLKYTEQQILSAMESQDHGNSCINVSRSLTTSQLKAERSVNLGHNLSYGSTSLLRRTPVHDGMNSLLRTNLFTSSESPKVSAGNLSGAQVGNGNGFQNEDSTIAASHSLTSFTSRGSFPLPLEGSDQKILPIDSKFASTDQYTDYDLFHIANVPSFHVEEHVPISGQSVMTVNSNHNEACAQHSSGDDLFDVLGMEFKNQLLNGNRNKLLGDESDAVVENMVNKEISMNVEGMNSDYYSVNESISDSGIFFSEMETDNLLDAVVSKAAKQTVKQNSDDMSCRTTLTGSSTSSIPFPVCRKVTSGNFQEGLFDFSKNGGKTKTGAVETSSLRSGCGKNEARNCSRTTTVYGSQLSSLVENGGIVKRENSVSTGYSKRPDEANKSKRKRLKPGENPRPRPKDRQMIQDRVKELREIVPNGGKCSIDALLERTIKHMLFLQSVTKHADKLKQAGESKIISKEDGLLLKDNFEGGATWAYEIGSQSMVCPIIVEDLNPPRQMLVEMLCEEQGFFLEIADLIRGLGLTILKGKMEVHKDKIWARFAVEANRDVTRMEIFMSLVRVLEQKMKGSASSSNTVDDIMGYPDTSNWK